MERTYVAHGRSNMVRADVCLLQSETSASHAVLEYIGRVIEMSGCAFVVYGR